MVPQGLWWGWVLSLSPQHTHWFRQTFTPLVPSYIFCNSRLLVVFASHDSFSCPCSFAHASPSQNPCLTFLSLCLANSYLTICPYTCCIDLHEACLDFCWESLVCASIVCYTTLLCWINSNVTVHLPHQSQVLVRRYSLWIHLCIPSYPKSECSA